LATLRATYRCMLTSSSWQRCVGFLFILGHFPQKSFIISGSFAEYEQRIEDARESLPSHIVIFWMFRTRVLGTFAKSEL